MKKLERSELEAVIRINANPDFQIFTGIIKDSAYELAIKNSNIQDETQLRWNQGRTQELLDILKKIRDAGEDLDYLRKQVRKP
jgi:hypothetical protein